MGTRSTVTGYWRQNGNAASQVATPAVYKAYIAVAFDPTAAAAGTGKYLPKGAIPLGVTSLGGSTGGISPTVDVQLAGGTAAGLANELASDAYGAEVVTGADLGAALTADTEIEAGVGGSAATGGTTTVLVSYLMQDDGVRNN